MTAAIAAIPPPGSLAWGVELDQAELEGTTGGDIFLLFLGIMSFGAAIGILDALIFGGCSCRSG